jgi:hypothetical protein
MNKKEIKYLLIAGAVYLILFRPVRTATIIGGWIHDFFGTLITQIIG